MTGVVAWIAGLVFGLGLVLSGMTQPQKVLGFLDPFGAFDASLLVGMFGAIAVHFSVYRASKTIKKPTFAPGFFIPSRSDVDAKLLSGAAIFGLGWGLAGYCPGPAIVSLVSGSTSSVAFFAAMVAGMFATAKIEQLSVWRKLSQPAALRNP
ncbi:MAG TPA: DUF6691 family protein [Polyangiales bacterium]|nr:DUF6691 family protein [Polyangiales bacterium]